MFNSYLVSTSRHPKEAPERGRDRLSHAAEPDEQTEETSSRRYYA
jgi:hypothetical protein